MDPSCCEDIDGRQLETEMPDGPGFAGALSSIADIRRGQRAAAVKAHPVEPPVIALPSSVRSAAMAGCSTDAVG